MKAVLDTNILLSGLLWKGPPAKIIDAWNHRLFDVVITKEIFAEYQEVLKRFSKGQEFDIEETMSVIGERAFWCAPALITEAVCSDPDDDKFIAAGLGGNAEYIVTGDKALLLVESFATVKIVNSRSFLSIIG